MRYAIDAEFIDTPTCSALISLAVACESGASVYFEFDYPKIELTPWLRENVVPHLTMPYMDPPTFFHEAAEEIKALVEDDSPEFWCYQGAYDWYWFCRVFGGLMQLPTMWPHRYKEYADLSRVAPPSECRHNALSDAQALVVSVARRMAA